MSQTIMQRVARANENVPSITQEELMRIMGDDNVVIVDIRDHPELANGKIRGALHITRGMLEFRAQPGIPSHHPDLTPDKTVVLYCGSGGRAALAGQALQDMGYTDVRNLGGFADWVKVGGAVEPV